jgi:hypothetical protein
VAELRLAAAAVHRLVQEQVKGIIIPCPWLLLLLLLLLVLLLLLLILLLLLPLLLLLLLIHLLLLLLLLLLLARSCSCLAVCCHWAPLRRGGEDEAAYRLCHTIACSDPLRQAPSTGGTVPAGVLAHPLLGLVPVAAPVESSWAAGACVDGVRAVLGAGVEVASAVDAVVQARGHISGHELAQLLQEGHERDVEETCVMQVVGPTGAGTRATASAAVSTGLT